MASFSPAGRALLEEIYSLQREVRMSAIYYEARLSRVQRAAMALEVSVALTASGSGLTGLAFWSSDWGQPVWAAVTIAATVAAIVKPIYASGAKIELFTRQHQGYLENFFALKKLGFAIRQDEVVSPDHRKLFDTIFDRHVQITSEDENNPDRKLLHEAQLLCEEELPSDIFWRPWAEPAASAPAAVEPGR